MAEHFPVEEIETIDENLCLHVGKNSVVYRCPYSQEYIPRNQAAISLGQEDTICFDPKYLQEMLSGLRKESLSDHIEYLEKSESDCVCCDQSGDGYIIEMVYYISCDLNTRTGSLPMEDRMGSHKETNTLFLCWECMKQLPDQFPSEIVNSVVASQTL